jgi:hypothetical protein
MFPITTDLVMRIARECDRLVTSCVPKLVGYTATATVSCCAAARSISA